METETIEVRIHVSTFSILCWKYRMFLVRRSLIRLSKATEQATEAMLAFNQAMEEAEDAGSE